MKKGKRLVLIGTVLAVLAVAVSAYMVHAEQEALAQQLIRLHVVANSDSERDQAVKLQVRDAILEQMPAITEGCETKQAAQAALQAALPQLCRESETVLRENGFEDSVTVRLAQEQFPTRTYDTFSLPAGEYTSLRIEIGAAAGHNWWCVVFPTLCTAATTDDVGSIAASSGFTEEQINLMTDDSGEYRVKFKLLEYWQALQDWLS